MGVKSAMVRIPDFNILSVLKLNIQKHFESDISLFGADLYSID